MTPRRKRLRVRRFEWDGTDPGAQAAAIRKLAPPLAEVSDEVASIIAEVGRRGDKAVAELTARHDAVRRRPKTVRVDRSEIDRAAAAMDDGLRDALELAARNIRLVAESRLEVRRDVVELPEGHAVMSQQLPVRAAGVYAPGGRAAYPSSVLMCCVPARVAGVPRLAVASPPGPDGGVSAAVLGACAVAGADEVYAMGGAQAIAAFALGTSSVPRVDVVVGPGNRYVQEAKRQLSAIAGTDAVAGPTELMVILDRERDLERVALDLCAQAEHGDDGLLVAAAPESGLLDGLAGRFAARRRERPSVLSPALALVEAPDVRAAGELADAIAPEHLELICTDASMMAQFIGSAGAVFVGPSSGAAFGDYVAGSNHVIPTGGAARFAGPLGPETFRKRTTIVHLDERSAAALAGPLDEIARAEGFPVHAESARARAER
jgi:histidinol dehydrogenase